MGAIYYGTRTFSKHMGYFGPKQECQNCHRTYQKAIVRFKSWFHIDYIPLIPTKTQYFKSCPICGAGFELRKQDAKTEMQTPGDGTVQTLEPHAKHILANKPKGLLASDNSYELWMKDGNSGEDICIASEISKEDIKRFKKERGWKKVPMEKVE